MSFEMPTGPVVLEPQDSPEHPLAPWFAGARQHRAEHYAGRRRKAGGSRAVITIVHNEPVFLPIWLGWYSRFFASEDIYVLDNDSTDGSTDRGGFVRIPVANDEVDHRWMARTIEGLQHELLDRYDVVVVADVDEIITPVPEWGTLGEYLDRFDEESVNCLGYEILHDPANEPPLSFDRPILDQRGTWFFNDGYDKAAVATEPMTWKPGFHGRADGHFNLDPDLRLIHLHRMDFGICRERHLTRRRRAWADEDERSGWATHNRITEDQEFERWFSHDSCFEGVEINREAIAASWRGLF
jgi:Glycosyl transferase family 2